MSRFVLLMFLGAVLWQFDALHAAERPIWHYSLSNESATELEDGLEKFRTQFNPELTWHVSSDLLLTAEARLLWDPAFDGWESELAPREFTLDGQVSQLLIRLGLQQVPWGQASGFLSGFDIFHPRDLREFVLPPFEFLRRPLWMAYMQQPLGEMTIEAIWSPESLVDRIAEPGEPFFTSTPQFAGFSQIDGGEETDAHKFGLRLSARHMSWDFNFLYLVVPRNDAVFSREALSGNELRTLERHKLYHAAGLTFAKASGTLVWRGELSCYIDREYQTTDTIGGVERAGQINPVIGIDLTSLRDLDLAIEIAHKHIFDYQTEFLEPQDRTTILFRARKPFFHDILVSELSVIFNLHDSDALFRPALMWAVTDRFEARIGADILFGPEDSPFGRFDDRDRFYVYLTYRQ